MILTTTESIEGQNIQSYLGIVTGVEVSMPEQTLSFKMEKYYTNYENKINEVKEAALKKLKDNASQLRANAVVGIRIDVETSPSSNSMIIVSITGTAVTVF